MNSKYMNLTVAVIAAVTVFTLASCCKTKNNIQSDSAEVYQMGVPGGYTVETHKWTAQVTGIDAAKRSVTLMAADGKTNNVKCGPEVINFDQIQIGDEVKVIATEELAVYIADAATATNDSSAAAVALAPKGAMPGGAIAATTQLTATVTSIDLKRHRATLRFPDGSTHKVAVRKDVDLAQRKIGEKVVIRITDALAITVEKQ